MQETTNKRGRKSELDKLKLQMAEMQSQQGELLEQFRQIVKAMNVSIAQNNEVEKTPKKEIIFEEEKKEEDFLEQPRSDELIRICSLTHGELNLSVGGRIAMSFRKYGDIKPVLYSTLVNIVNENRSFAECGDFYIMDKRAVYHLGLTEYYKRIYPLETLNNIENYDSSDIEKILGNMCAQQKETVIINIAKKIYEDEPINQNSVKTIEKKLDVDIHGMVRTMREIDENLK